MVGEKSGGCHVRWGRSSKSTRARGHRLWDRISGVLAHTGCAPSFRLALVHIELLLNHRLRSCLLPRRLMFCLKLHPAALADSDHRNVLDSLHDAKIALGHEYSLPQFCPATAYLGSHFADQQDAGATRPVGNPSAE